MTIDYRVDTYKYLSDDTTAINSETKFILTAQNKKYFEALKEKPSYITPYQLIQLWNLESLKVVGVTGTNGKTTVTAAIYSFLLDLGEKPALLGTRGFFVNEERIEEKSMTTPSILHILSAMKIAKDKGGNYFIMEVSSHAIHQERIEGLEFALKVHTNVTSDHLDYHGTVEEYKRVKSLFFADASPKLLNKDDIKNITYNPIGAQSYGVDEPATFKVQAFSLQHGITAGIKHLSTEATFHSPMVGLFNLFNLMAAIGACTMLTGRNVMEVCEVVSNFAGVAGRMEVVSTKPLIIVDFAHTDDGMIQVLDSMKDREISVVFGAGGDRDRGKRPRMGAVAAKFAKKVYVTSDNPRSEAPEEILKDILSGIKDQSHTRAMVDRAFAIQEALKNLEEGEVLMILGKGDEDTMEVNGEKFHFDDREIVRALLAEIDN
ncbi:MAG: UDP-N-acetylmuramoylalanyl-D-glutamate--2,6-diaminopimelate ligase (EC [uncultured Sulfurovum sp.]|uniref:UDP-N-acetylmuramoyl-L-alanyl-D-glutamate--2,6-diaminopimelate ligase n=1 Tax=uncultured Sulfurovum sp. TaxID=269237 RepID=A0A6S6SG93_9BACT|nr:MAG: UDP-N-acetylmuramoylalanyl-D-glutamate--2,6-diaminopimelate ligase (EC [uncultured Sulfurovum sp.]